MLLRYYEAFIANVKNVNAAFNEWFNGFKTVTTELKRRDGAKKNYDHYDKKVTKMKRDKQ